jgi:phage shock protein A
MSYFSRLTDIVTCNLTELLAQAPDPQRAIAAIIREMEEGLAGAQRSMTTASNRREQLAQNLDQHQQQVQDWMAKAKSALVQQQEQDARQFLARKREVEDLIAGLQQEFHSATRTCDHLATMQRALEARHAEAVRRQAEILGGTQPTQADPVVPSAVSSSSASSDRLQAIEDELAALKQQLGQ